MAHNLLNVVAHPQHPKIQEDIMSSMGGDLNIGRERSRNEGKVTSMVEKRTARIPSIVYLGLAGASMAASLSLFALQRREDAIFVGTWAPTFLILGLYNKVVKETEPLVEREGESLITSASH